MSDTATTTAPDQSTMQKNGRGFDVEYTLEIVDDLPPQAHGGGSGRQSPLELKLDELKGREDAHGKWVLIGKYGKATAAGAAANVLRQRHGRNANAEGFEFAYRKIDQGGSSVNGLFVKYDPAKVVPGALEAHKTEEAARLERLKVEAERRKAEAAAAVNGTGTPADGTADGAAPQGSGGDATAAAKDKVANANKSTQSAAAKPAAK